MATAEVLYERLTGDPASKPPPALVKRLEERIKSLKEVRQQLATEEAMNLVNPKPLTLNSKP